MYEIVDRKLLMIFFRTVNELDECTGPPGENTETTQLNQIFGEEALYAWTQTHRSARLL